MNKKRIVYILLFVVLGIIISFIIHALIELPILRLLTKDFDKYGFGLTWAQWYSIHYLGSIILLLLGIVTGYLQGKYWWRIIYIEKKYISKFFKKK